MKVFFFSLSVLLIMLPGCNFFAPNGSNDDASQNNQNPEGVIIVANKSGNDVYFIDPKTGETLAVLPAGLEPHEVEVSDDGSLAVVCNYGNRDNPGNTLSVYDVKKATLSKTINLGEHTFPHGMQWITGKDHLLVTTEGSNSLLIVDISEGLILDTLNTGEQVSHMVAATPDFSKAFVPSIRTGNVAVFDLKNRVLADHIYSGKGAEGIDVTPDGRELWVTNRDENTISVFDTKTLQKIHSLVCEDFPIRSKFTPDGNLFLVSNARSGTIEIFDVTAKKHIHSMKLTPPLPENADEDRYFTQFEGTSIPIGLVIPDNKTAYVANTRSDAVSIIDLENFEITRHFKAGKEPDGIGYSNIRPDKQDK
jgi:YVTN family beta-propeller protein